MGEGARRAAPCARSASRCFAPSREASQEEAPPLTHAPYLGLLATWRALISPPLGEGPGVRTAPLSPLPWGRGRGWGLDGARPGQGIGRLTPIPNPFPQGEGSIRLNSPLQREGDYPQHAETAEGRRAQRRGRPVLRAQRLERVSRQAAKPAKRKRRPAPMRRILAPWCLGANQFFPPHGEGQGVGSQVGFVISLQYLDLRSSLRHVPSTF